MICIFCDMENDAKSVEHIVPESLGNKDYTVKRGRVCDTCNSAFAKFEKKALGFSVFIMERVRMSIPTKQGKAAKGKVGKFSIEGSSEFKKGLITMTGMDMEDLKDFDPSTGIGHITIPSFDKSEVPTSKLLLKIALESIFTSRRNLFDKYDFTELKTFVRGKSNIEWPFLTTEFELAKFESIPRFLDKYRLSKIPCGLKFVELDKQNLIFQFKYGGIPMTINLINRNLDWIRKTIESDEKAVLYPQHYRNKL